MQAHTTVRIPLSATLGCLLLCASLVTGCGLSPEKNDWRIIDELDLKPVSKEQFADWDELDPYERAVETLGGVEGVEITSPDHFTERGYGYCKQVLQAFHEEGGYQFYGWYNENNEVMVGIFKNGKAHSAWDGDSMIVFVDKTMQNPPSIDEVNNRGRRF